MNYVAIPYDNHELVAATTGEGPPILLIPGHTMSIDRWVEAGYVKALARERQVVIVDPLGHGRSSKSSVVEDYSSENLVGHLYAVLEHFEFEQVDVWGYSRGALMGGMLARQHPERVRSLIYGGNVLFDPRPILEAFGLLADIDVLRAAHERSLMGDWSAYWENFPLPLPAALMAEIETRNDLPSISASGLAGQIDPVQWSAPKGVPTLAYWGTDEVFHEKNTEIASDQDIRTATISGGHAQAFDPSTAALAVVEPFLNGLSEA